MLWQIPQLVETKVIGVIKQLITRAQARTGYKEFTSFPCARFDPYLVYCVYVNKLGRVSLYCSLILTLFFLAALNQCFASDKGIEFIAHPPTWYPVQVSQHCKHSLIPKPQVSDHLHLFLFPTHYTPSSEQEEDLSQRPKSINSVFKLKLRQKEWFVRLAGFWIASERERSYHPYQGLELTRVKGLKGLIVEHGLIKHHWSVGSLVNFNFSCMSFHLTTHD